MSASVGTATTEQVVERLAAAESEQARLRETTNETVFSLEKLAKTIGNLRIVIGLLTAILIAAFVAGVYYSNGISAFQQFSDEFAALKAKSVSQEQKIAALELANQQLKTNVINAFANFGSMLSVDGKIHAATEPADNGGSNLAECPAGAVMTKIQLYKYDGSEIRELRVQCATFDAVEIP